MIFVLMLVGGLALAAVNTWQRLGRSRSARRWTRGMHRDFAHRNVLVLWPLLAVALLLGAGLGAAQRLQAPTLPFALLLLLTLAAWVAFAALPIPVPSFVQPRWYRQQTGGQDRASRG